MPPSPIRCARISTRRTKPATPPPPIFSPPSPVISTRTCGSSNRIWNKPPELSYFERQHEIGQFSDFPPKVGLSPKIYAHCCLFVQVAPESPTTPIPKNLQSYFFSAKSNVPACTQF